jgi:hypothetical protein
MDRAEKKVKTLSEAELKKIFDAVRRGKSRDCVCSLLKPRDPTTVRRVYNVALEFQNRGLEVLDDDAACQIAVKAKYGVTSRRVKALFIAWQHWKTGGKKPGERAQWLRQRHLDRLLHAVNPIRKCISNPWDSWGQTLPRRPLLLGGHDWALVPKLWFYVVTPNFDDESDWGRAFPQLKEHLEKSPFWDDLDELEAMTLDLAKDLDIAAEKLGRTNDGFRKTWLTFQGEISSVWRLQESRTPSNPVPDWEKINLHYDAVYARRVCEEFTRGVMPDVYDRLRALSDKLEVLRQDLEPGVVDKVIAEGAYPDCPG